MFGRKLSPKFLWLVLAIGGVFFLLNINSANANDATSLLQQPVSTGAEIEDELLEVLATEGTSDFLV
ncbi:MAG: hypothetical protein KDI55_29315, partial [Anaerolineae bacterium]|nr:hypothetical protein [Anaerolineae bacterium]